MQISSADNLYAPPSATYQENDQDEFVQIPAADSVHSPPSKDVDQLNRRGCRRTRRTRKQVVVIDVLK